MDQTLERTIRDALREAMIMEHARDKYNTDNVILTAQRLSGAPHSFVKDVFREMKGYTKYDI